MDHFTNIAGVNTAIVMSFELKLLNFSLTAYLYG